MTGVVTTSAAAATLSEPDRPHHPEAAEHDAGAPPGGAPKYPATPRFEAFNIQPPSSPALFRAALQPLLTVPSASRNPSDRAGFSP